MKRYFFHLEECGVVLEDDEGKCFDSLEAARKFGCKAARDVMSNDVQDGELCLDAYVLIEESGMEVGRIRFKEALRIMDL